MRCGEIAGHFVALFSLDLFTMRTHVAVSESNRPVVSSDDTHALNKENVSDDQYCLVSNNYFSYMKLIYKRRHDLLLGLEAAW